MALVRPEVTIFDADNGNETKGTVVMPHVMSAPIRPDLVRFVHSILMRSRMQPHGTKPRSGYGYSAHSWGTGRALARIPRVSGGGTHKCGQGALGNMCKGGGMYSPKKVWRKWGRKVNDRERRHAIASAIAASGSAPLVMAHGHRIDEVREFPIVVSDEIQDVKRTKSAYAMLCRMGLEEDLQKAKDSRHMRSGRGKMRNRRYTCRRAPLLIYDESQGCDKAFRNIPGVDLLNVNRLSLLKLAPGGQLGRLIVWTESAFKKLDQIFGSTESGTSNMKKYSLPRNIMTNADVNRILKSLEVQLELNPAKECQAAKQSRRNPLRNLEMMQALNPAFVSNQVMPMDEG